MFQDRLEAGKKLAEALSHLQGENLIVVGIPRGGIIVAVEVAKHFSAPLDIVFPRKIGAPGNPELAIGAVVEKGEIYLNEGLVKSLGVSKEYIEEEVKRELLEIKRRKRDYLGGREELSYQGKTVILVDDGLATGYTALAALRALRKKKPGKLILAVPVSPSETLEFLKPYADKVFALEVPYYFYAVGQFYRSFEQVSDEEVKEVISKYGS